MAIGHIPYSASEVQVAASFVGIAGLHLLAFDLWKLLQLHIWTRSHTP